MIVPSMDSLQKIATALNISVGYLIGEKDESGISATATYRSVSNLNGTETTTNTLAEKNIIVECGDGAKKIRLIFPKSTPGDVLAKAITAAVGTQKDEGA
jgi:transcriptional regulator with XRE-family HTH domain